MIEVHPHQPDGGSCPWRSHQQLSGAWARESRTYFLRGIAAHEARAWALTRYLDDKELPPLGTVLESAAQSAEARNEEDAEKGGGLSPEEVTAAIDEALPIVTADYRLVLPEIAPHVVAVEETLEAELEDGVVLKGTIDVRGQEPSTGTGFISDLKTAAKSPGKKAEQSAALSTQLSLYAALHLVHYGTLPVHALTYVWVMANGPKAETIKRDNLKVCDMEGGGVGVARTITTQRSRADVDAALLRVRYRVDAERNNFFPPANPGGITSECARCHHWAHEDATQRCPFVPTTKEVGHARSKVA